MSAATNSRKRTVRIEVGADARSYVSDGQRVTLVPLTIKRRQNRKLLIPPAPDAATAAGGFDVPMIKTLGKAFYWKRLIDFDLLIEEGTISPENLNLFRYKDTPQEAWDAIQGFYRLQTTD